MITLWIIIIFGLVEKDLDHEFDSGRNTEQKLAAFIGKGKGDGNQFARITSMFFLEEFNDCILYGSAVREPDVAVDRRPGFRLQDYARQISLLVGKQLNVVYYLEFLTHNFTSFQFRY